MSYPLSCLSTMIISQRNMEIFELRWFYVLYFLILLLHFQFDCSLSFSFNSSSTPPRHCPPDESFALLQFKNTLSVDCSSCPDCYYFDRIWSIGVGNMSYPKTSSWKAGTNCCLWDGVMCDTETGYVIGLDLSCSCLRGIIPSNTSLVLLRRLRKLNLAFNNFSSAPIASEFGQFTTLTHLNVSNSHFSGIIPSAMFSHLHKLVSLDLSDNDLRFEGNSFENLLRNLTQIRELFLHAINLSSVAPTSFHNLSSSIMVLSLGDNDLHGELPEGIFRFPYLQKLKITNYLLYGSLEVNFPKANWSSSLRSLEVSFVNLARALSLLSSIGNLRFLEVLDLCSCNLKGSIPESFGNLTRLTYLDLSYNSVIGQHPSSFSNFKQLRYLDLSANQLHGQIPDAFGNLTKLFHLSSRDNQFSGHFRFSVFDLANIVYLDLSDNFLSGRIPPWLFTLPSLFALYLNDNKFNGPIDQFEQPSASLEYVHLQNNEIHGPIPSSVFKLVNLTYLDLSSNMLTGISETNNLSKLNKLEMLDLSNNALLSFKSESKANYIWAPNLSVLKLSTCNISEFPYFVGTLEGLEHLDLSWNKIRVIEADMFSKLKNLSWLDLSLNSQISLSTTTGVSLFFPNLRSLSCSSCNISEFSDFLRNLEGLEDLDLSYNRINVIEAGMLSKLKNLTSLDLSHNSQLSLSNTNNVSLFLPNLRLLSCTSCNISEFSDFVRNLEGLEDLDLSYNRINVVEAGMFSKLINLKWLGLSYNRINVIEVRMFSKLKNLRWLDLSHNSQLSLSNTNNASLFLPNLSSLSCSSCNISEFSDFVRNLEGLEDLDLSYNRINVIEADMFSKLKNLRRLDLSYNSELSLSTTNNVSLFFPNLRLLSCSSCNISEFSDLVRNLEGLKDLDLSYNRINVIEADMFSKLKNLRRLDLSYNSELSLGTNLSLPLPSLETLLLSSCNATEFPHFLRTLEELTLLDLSNNSIHGKISMGQSEGWPSLTWLDLSNNSLTDIEHYPWKNVQILNLRSNLLEGPLLVPPPSTHVFLISKNRLRGQLPSSICGLNSLEILDVSDNILSGTFPNCLGAFSNGLHILDLHRNNFHGNIPDSFVRENVLQTINLSNNDLDGPLPKSLMNCSQLEVLNVGNNKISDTFPNWLGALPELKVFVLRSNNFHGQITNSNIGYSFSSLRIFDLSRNGFSGSLPTCFERFKSIMNLANVEMRYMGDQNDYYHDSMVLTLKDVDIKFERILTIFTVIDLSSNLFGGEIPEIVGDLSSLQVLNFSHNNLTGYIPSTMGNLTELESLDLSSNKLVGQIPTQLAGLRFLEVLNLSQNQLVGPIPLGNQFNTFLNDSYSGNLGLCGFPLSKICGKTEAETPPFHEEADSESGFEWKAALMGYGSGLVIGISMGYIIFTLGKPKWLVRMVEGAGHKLSRYCRGRRNL